MSEQVECFAEVRSPAQANDDTARHGWCTRQPHLRVPLHPTEICGSGAQSRCREAQADGEYAEALSRCGAAAASLDAIQGLAVAGGLAASVDELAADTAAQLASALQAVCTDFGGQQFMRVGSGSGS